MSKTLSRLARGFLREERGVALSEYLIILGLLVGSIVIAVGLFGTNLGNAFVAFANWIGTLDP